MRTLHGPSGKRTRASFAAITAAVLCVACGSGPRRSDTTLPAPRKSCAEDHYWNGKACTRRGAGAEHLAQGTAALAAFRVEEALPLLGRARAEGPHRHADHVKIHEQLGIAYSYLEREEAALEAFEMLLSLDPGHLLSYTLSPKATFLFEKARRRAEARTPPSLHVSWPYDLSVASQVPIDVEVVADPKAFLRRATLHMRRKGTSEFREVDLRLPPPGAYKRVLIPALGTHEPEVLQIYLTAFDDRGNEVLLWADETRPREIALRYDAPVPWYRKWWIWAVAGGVVAAGTGAAVYIASRDPPDTINGVLDIRR